MSLPQAVYPGNPHHQSLLKAIVSYYENDPRVRAVIVFGSLGRGNWDDHSDLDLNIILEDGVVVEPLAELRRLCLSFLSIGESPALVIPDGEDAADAVLESLRELSVRYHPLGDTSPNILDTMILLAGRLEPEQIRAAGSANRIAGQPDAAVLIDRFLRYAVETGAALQRRRIWLAVELLHRMRGLLIEVFGRTHDAPRALHAFEASADAELQARLQQTLSHGSLGELQLALLKLLEMLEKDLSPLSNGQAQLADRHHALLSQIRHSQAGLQFEDNHAGFI